MAATIRIYGKLCTVEAGVGMPVWTCPENAELEKKGVILNERKKRLATQAGYCGL
jgi:hypothetical protein